MIVLKIAIAAFIINWMINEWRRHNELHNPKNKPANFEQHQIDQRRSEQSSPVCELIEDVEVMETEPEILQIPANIPIDVREVAGKYQVIIDSKYLKIPE